jgi:hypothetical protein
METDRVDETRRYSSGRRWYSGRRDLRTRRFGASATTGAFAVGMRRERRRRLPTVRVAAQGFGLGVLPGH